jgi:hypothetical protein
MQSGLVGNPAIARTLEQRRGERTAAVDPKSGVDERTETPTTVKRGNGSGADHSLWVPSVERGGDVSGGDVIDVAGDAHLG